MSEELSDEQEELLARVRERRKPMVEGHVYPAKFATQNLGVLRDFVSKVSELASTMGVRFEAIDPKSDEDRQVLMKLIGATRYNGTVKLNDPALLARCNEDSRQE